MNSLPQQTEQASHTPGPWKVFDDPHSMHRIICTADGSSIADANAGFPCSEQEQDANARLIAASPSLLAACKAALDEYEGEDPGASCDDQPSADEARATARERRHAALRAAIAAAEGGA